MGGVQPSPGLLAGGWLDVCVVRCVFGVRGVSVLRVGLGLRCRRMVGACVVCLLCVRVRVFLFVGVNASDTGFCFLL